MTDGKRLPQSELLKTIVREWLAEEMSRYSKNDCCAGWQTGNEYIIWDAINNRQGWTAIIFEKRLAMMRDAAEWLGQWCIWDNGRKFIPLDEWEEMYRTKRKEWSK